MHLFEGIENFIIVIIFSGKFGPHQGQSESMAKLYMNRFAIEEDDQFEIHVKITRKDYNDYNWSGEEEMYNAAAEVMLRAQQG